MIQTTVSGPPVKVLRVAAIASSVIATLVVAAAFAAGHPLFGVEAAAGLGLGLLNAQLIDGLHSLRMPLGATSTFRLASLTAIVIAVAVIGGSAQALAVAAGLALAQLAVAATAAFATVRG